MWRAFYLLEAKGWMRLCKTDVWPSVARGDDDLCELRLYDAAWRKRVCHERRYGVWLYPARYGEKKVIS